MTTAAVLLLLQPRDICRVLPFVRLLFVCVSLSFHVLTAYDVRLVCALGWLHPYYPTGHLCLGRGPVVQTGALAAVQQCWLFGAAAAVIVPFAAYTASKQGIASKHQERTGLLSRAWLFFSVRDSCVSVVCGLSGTWLAMTSAVVFMTARAMLQLVLRRSEHDNCSRAIVAAATRYLPRAVLCMFDFFFVCVCVSLPLHVLTAYDVRSCVCAWVAASVLPDWGSCA